MANQTTITANQELVREFIRRVFNEHNAHATSDYFSPDVRWHGGTLGTIEGSDAMTTFYGDLFARDRDPANSPPDCGRQRRRALPGVRL
jgi:limonene-1,2-epoxide hydrolase